MVGPHKVTYVLTHLLTYLLTHLRTYLSAPAWSCDAMLNMTKVKSELIPDPDMFIFFWKSMRVGVSYSSNGYSKANQYLLHPKSYDPKQESKHVIYLDANLYSYAISKFIPASGFTRIDPKKSDLIKYTSNSWRGCILKVDLG